jgi:phage/plasmid primase, P4 family, C-terminal domain
LATACKKPAVRWAQYQVKAPSLDEAQEWWGNGHPWGIALICGTVSGNLEMTEIEGRATDQDSITAVANMCDELGCGDVWDRLVSGYTQSSPSGGLHLLYRISDHSVPGNTKLARRPATPEELTENSEDVLKVLAETRGEGGYVVGAPSPGACHPSGEPWLLTSGRYGDLPTVTWEERNRLHRALTLALDKSAQPQSVQSDTTHPIGAALPLSTRPVIPSHPDFSTPPSPALIDQSPHIPPQQLSPGDDFAARTDWSRILEPVGWQLESHRGEERMWTRPGKDPRDGASASTGYQGKPGLFVWSTSAGLPTEEPLSKLFVYAHYYHGGDMSAAGYALIAAGYGQRLPAPVLDGMLMPEVGEERGYTFDDTGNAERLLDRVRGRYFYVYEEKCFYAWTGTVWECDYSGRLNQDTVRMTEDMAKKAKETGDAALGKWTRATRNEARGNGCRAAMSKMSGVTKRAGEFNPNRHLINLRNGILDLRTRQLVPHNPSFLMTRTFGASFQEGAPCPRFEKFMEDVLPDPGMRDYVRRALGYTLLGDADRRSMFLIHGPSGTGKSTLMEIMRFIFGDYGITAASGAFRSHRDGHITNDLHGLRGKRFVTTSETAETTSFDEDLLKRLTGRDRVESRELYQVNQEWTPECVLWLATNHPPRFNSDDDAIWRRAKLIPFTTQFTGEREIPDLARRILAEEADGILNWLLAGLTDFQANGLGEPEAVALAAQEQRHQSDSTMRFLDDRLADGILVEGEENRVRYTELFQMYQEYVRTFGEKPLGVRRFINRLSDLSTLESRKVGGHMYWYGIGRAAGVGIMGNWIGLPAPPESP